MHQPDNPCIHHKGFNQAFDNIHSIHVQTQRGSMAMPQTGWLLPSKTRIFKLKDVQETETL